MLTKLKRDMADHFIKNSIIFLSVCFFFMLAGGCSDREESPPPSPEPGFSVNTLRIGLIPEHDIFSQKNRYEPLAAYLSRKLGVRIELQILSRYGNIIDNFVSNKLDGAFFGSFTGALAIRKLGVAPLARPEYLDGSSTYYGLILVRQDSNIKTCQDMKGKRFAFVDKATTAGWLLPLHYFIECGISDYHRWFRETYFAGTHEDVIYDVLNGKADIGAAKNTVFSRLAKQDPAIESSLNILATSPKVPANGLAVRRDLGAQLKSKLKQTLLDMDQDPDGRVVLENFGAVRFIDTTVKDYDPVFQFADHIGLALTDYDYMND